MEQAVGLLVEVCSAGERQLGSELEWTILEGMSIPCDHLSV